MPNILNRLEIEIEKKVFSFLLVFFIIFFGIDVVSVIMIEIERGGFWILFWYLIPLFITLLFSGLIVDNRRRAWFLILLIPEGLLTLVLAFVINDTVALSILWVFLGIISGFTITAMLAFFADVTKMEQRGKIAGLISGIAWIISAIVLSWHSSTIFAPNILMVAFGIIKLIGAGIAIYILIAKTDETIAPVMKSESTDEGFLQSIVSTYNFLWGNQKFRTYLIAFMLIWLTQGIFLPIGGFGQTSYPYYQEIASIGFAAGGLFLVVSGFLLDKGRKQVLVYGAILGTISFLSYYFPIGAVFLAGLPILITTIIIVLGDISPQDERGRYYSVFLSLNLVAFFIGFFIGYGLGGGYHVGGSPWVALTCLIITGIGLLLIYLWGKESNLEEVSFPPSEPSPAPSLFESSLSEDFSMENS
ncbi:MAG: MFS transporter [Candidatus Helarchaeota archaeon]|nr:MFS transporter [Candidatus Helarchaeota archaeon]